MAGIAPVANLEEIEFSPKKKKKVGEIENETHQFFKVKIYYSLILEKNQYCLMLYVTKILNFLKLFRKKTTHFLHRDIPVRSWKLEVSSSFPRRRPSAASSAAARATCRSPSEHR